MPRDTFLREIERLQRSILELGGTVAEALVESVEVLRLRDLKRAGRIIQYDECINARRFAIEADSLTLVATQQPVASDMRFIAAVLEIATELERTGDYAKGISRITLLRGLQPSINPPARLTRMAAKSADMLDRALQAFARQDAEAARAIAAEDDEVDALYNRVYQETIALVMEDLSLLDEANRLLWVAHNLERSADRVTNICERVVFTVTGEMRELDSEAVHGPADPDRPCLGRSPEALHQDRGPDRA